MNKMFIEVNKMSIKMNEIRENWNLIKKQVETAEKEIKNNEIGNAIYFTWLAAENLMNTLKTQIDGYFTTSHRKKVFDAKRFYLKHILNKDYSATIKKLSKLRLVAGFSPYTRTKQSYTREDAKKFLKDIKSLMAEVEEKLKKGGII